MNDDVCGEIVEPFRGFGIYVGDGWHVHSMSLRRVRLKYEIACRLPLVLRWQVAKHHTVSAAPR